jgi:membrane-associated protein
VDDGLVQDLLLQHARAVSRRHTNAGVAGAEWELRYRRTHDLVTLALLEFLDPENILTWLGPLALIGVTFIIFAECGLLIGFFLPGDSLLFITGCSSRRTSSRPRSGWPALSPGGGSHRGQRRRATGSGTRWAEAVQQAGLAVLPQGVRGQDPRVLREVRPRAIVLARFVPIVRTFITAMAGVGRMDFRVYMIYSAIGGLIWAAGVTYLGYRWATCRSSRTTSR